MKSEDIEKVLRENIVIQRPKDGPDYISNSTFKEVSILLESVCLHGITDGSSGYMIKSLEERAKVYEDNYYAESDNMVRREIWRANRDAMQESIDIVKEYLQSRNTQSLKK